MKSFVEFALTNLLLLLISIDRIHPSKWWQLLFISKTVESVIWFESFRAEFLRPSQEIRNQSNSLVKLRLKCQRLSNINCSYTRIPLPTNLHNFQQKISIKKVAINRLFLWSKEFFYKTFAAKFLWTFCDFYQNSNKVHTQESKFIKIDNSTSQTSVRFFNALQLTAFAIDWLRDLYSFYSKVFILKKPRNFIYNITSFDIKIVINYL